MNELLKRKRLEAGISALRLAQLSGSQEMRIYNFERGRFLPHKDEAIQISAALGCNPRELFPVMFAKIDAMAEVKS